MHRFGRYSTDDNNTHLNSSSLLQIRSSANTLSGMRQPAGELDTNNGISSRMIMLTVFKSKAWKPLPTSAALKNEIKPNSFPKLSCCCCCFNRRTHKHNQHAQTQYCLDHKYFFTKLSFGEQG